MQCALLFCLCLREFPPPLSTAVVCTLTFVNFDISFYRSFSLIRIHTRTQYAQCALHVTTFHAQHMYRLTNLRTLDLSKNSIQRLDPKYGQLKNLKSLNLDGNKLTGGPAVAVIAKLTKLQNLSLGGNVLGRFTITNSNSAPTSSSSSNKNAKEVLPTPLPPSLKQLSLNGNFLSNVPRSIVSVQPYLNKLEKLDLSSNQLASIPTDVVNLVKLIELNLDNNVIVSLPTEIGSLQNLKQLSLRNNHITVTSTNFDKNPQPLPPTLFTDTPLIDLNLHGNPMASTQLNSFVGYDKFLERRQQVKTNALLGGALTNLDVCGLE